MLSPEEQSALQHSRESSAVPGREREHHDLKRFPVNQGRLVRWPLTVCREDEKSMHFARRRQEEFIDWRKSLIGLRLRHCRRADRRPSSVSS